MLRVGKLLTSHWLRQCPQGVLQGAASPAAQTAPAHHGGVFWVQRLPFGAPCCSRSGGELSLTLFGFLGLIQPIPRNQFFQSYFNNNFVSEADRPYKCFYCHRAYKKSCHLKQHIR